eukprot:TRINITY_DN27817_c0_g1_i1.p1 TRINITY_DN27817_c0_g1~~TRINITY_DN27817_c0_g1_i1.p1  ORF type:complete len:310 (-),score=51.24 TRINITY_DN27817_c0_g1_i1:204-1133(-)
MGKWGVKPGIAVAGAAASLFAVSWCLHQLLRRRKPTAAQIADKPEETANAGLDQTAHHQGSSPSKVPVDMLGRGAVSVQVQSATSPAFITIGGDESSPLNIRIGSSSSFVNANRRNDLQLSDDAASAEQNARAEKTLSVKNRRCCSIFLRMTAAGFDMVPMIIGKQGSNTRSIAEATGCKVRVRGKGSGHREYSTGREAPVPLMMMITSENGNEAFYEAMSRSIDLLSDVEKRYLKHCQQWDFLAQLPGFAVSWDAKSSGELADRLGSKFWHRVVRSPSPFVAEQSMAHHQRMQAHSLGVVYSQFPQTW